MARIAIIGCGYVGTAFARQLVRHGHDVLGTTTTPKRHARLAAEGITPLLLRLDQTDRLHAALRDRDLVAFCAGAGRAGHYRSVYLEGMGSLTAALSGTSVTRVLYTSSTRVYGQADGPWVDERTEPAPADDRGRVLLQTERSLLAWADREGARVSAVVVRLGGIYGPGRALADRVRRASGKVLSGGSRIVNLIHLEDIVTALLLLCDSRYTGVLNLVDDQPEPRRTLYDRILLQEGLAEVQWVDDSAPRVARPNGPRSGAPHAPGPSMRAPVGKRVRNDLIKQTLDWRPAHPTHA